MGYFQIRYDSRGINYDRRGFIRLATGFERSCAAVNANVNVRRSKHQERLKSFYQFDDLAVQCDLVKLQP